MGSSDNKDLRVGEFLVENGIITDDQLDSALKMQVDNKERLIGEILVTLGFLSKEEMIMAFEMYLMITEAAVSHVDEWLDQDEIDMIMARIEEKEQNNK